MQQGTKMLLEFGNATKILLQPSMTYYPESKHHIQIE
uniref:Uncharacterized protein n=1 Tax=Rhizophora mucronata TaxID=61149 RepID=A0A2P2IL90_RHIMU